MQKSTRAMALFFVIASLGAFAVASPAAAERSVEKRDNNDIWGFLNTCYTAVVTLCATVDLYVSLGLGVSVIASLLVSIVATVVLVLTTCVTGLLGCTTGAGPSLTVIVQLCAEIIVTIILSLSACIDLGVSTTVIVSIDAALYALVEALITLFGESTLAVIVSACVTINIDIATYANNCGFTQLCGLCGW